MKERGIAGTGQESSTREELPRDAILTSIAIFRLTKAALLIAAGLGTLRLLHPGAAAALRNWIDALPFASEHELVRKMAARLTGLPSKRIDELAIAAFAYAALFLVEGTGLLLRQVWAEHVTLIATASFIPFEVYEVLQKPTALRIGVLGLNVAILIYLARRRWRAHQERKNEGPSGDR